MNKTLLVAWREFASTAFTKGFLIGVVMTPVMILIVIGAVFYMQKVGGPRLVGSVALIDQSGHVADAVRRRFTEEQTEKEAEELAAHTKEIIEKSPMAGAMGEQSKMAQAQAEAAVKEEVRKSAELTLEVLPSGADPEAEKKPLETARIRTRKGHDAAPDAAISRLALVVVPAGAVTPGQDGAYSGYSTFFPEKLDFEIQERIQRRVADAIVETRLANDPRIRGAGLSPDEVMTLIGRPKAESKTITAGGREQKSLGEIRMMIPMGFMILLMAAVFTGGQMLLTTTVEEKSNRVMEVLLSAASPMQIMVGKILGQMFVGLVVLVVYSGLAVAGIVIALKELQLISAMDIVYLVVFFVIAYFLVASMMAAIGSAVNDMREAQTLMTPVMVVFMLPWLLWFVIQRAPNSLLATILSFVPGPNPFVMVIRLSGSEPVPTWQIPVGIGVGVLSVVVAAWASAKIFRIGILMYGKPPNLATLIRWVRMA